MCSRIFLGCEAKGTSFMGGPHPGSISPPIGPATSTGLANKCQPTSNPTQNPSWSILPQRPPQQYRREATLSGAWSFILCPVNQGPIPSDDKDLEVPPEGRPPDLQDNRDTRFRFWVDDAALFGRRLHCHGHLLDRMWEQAGGFRTGGPRPNGFMEQVDPQVLGYNNMGMWDLLWSSPKNCLVASMRLRPGQVVSAVPGLLKVTAKREMVLSLQAAFGDAAFSITPMSFLIPEEVDAWRAHASRPAGAYHSSSSGAASQLPGSWWMLKQERSKGRGVRLCTYEEADTIMEHQSAEPQTGRRYLVVQQYITRPLLIGGRKWHMRSWMLVTCVHPLAAYLHRCGLVYFTNQPYHRLDHRHGSILAGQYPSWESLAASHLTNHFQNPGATVWSLGQLSQHLGGATWRVLWDQMCRAAAGLGAAGLKHMQAQHRQVGLPAGSDFQLLGLDFLVDSNLKVWLLEANGTPALDYDHELPEASQTMLEQKSRMLCDMCRMICLRFDQLADGMAGDGNRFAGSDVERGMLVGGQAGGIIRNSSVLRERSRAQDGLALVRREMERCGGFQPLMRWFDMSEKGAEEGWSVPWQASDFTLRDLLRCSAPAACLEKGQEALTGVVPGPAPNHSLA